MTDQKLEKKEEKLFTLEGSGKILAFTNINRQINRSIVNSKKKSIEEFGLLSPITVVDAKDVIEKGITVYDASNPTDVIDADNAENYLVILDGQHRYAAIKELNKKDKYYDIWLMYPLNREVAVSTLIMEINTTAINWKNDNYISVLAKLRPEDKGLAFIDKYMQLRHKRTKEGEQSDNLPNNGYGLSVLSKYLTLSTAINKDYLYRMANNPNKQLPDSIKVDRAEKIIQTGLDVGFTHTFLSSRFFIDWIINWVLQEYSVDKILECVKESMTDEKAKKLMDECKADNFSDLFDAAIELH